MGEQMNVVGFTNFANHYFHSPLIKLPVHLGIRPKLFSYIRTGYIVSQIGFIGGTNHRGSTHKKGKKPENRIIAKSSWHEILR